MIWLRDRSTDTRDGENRRGVVSFPSVPYTALIWFPLSERCPSSGRLVRSPTDDNEVNSLYSKVNFLIVYGSGVEMEEIWFAEVDREIRKENCFARIDI